MSRLIVLLTVAVVWLGTPKVQADYENYTNKILEKVPAAKGVKRVTKLDRRVLVEHSGVVGNSAAAFVVVRTNAGRWSKLLVQPAEQKLAEDKTVPILLIDRFLTYKDGTDRAIHTQGDNIRLFEQFEFNLDIGQVVPTTIGGDIRFVIKDGFAYAEPVGKAQFYLITKQLPEAQTAKGKEQNIGQRFRKEFFTGRYKLYDDGRRSGTLELKVGKDGSVTGHFYSKKDGRKYEVTGKVTEPSHYIEFSITYPRITEQFQGWMFTGNGRAFAGSARMQRRVFGFYAVRQ